MIRQELLKQRKEYLYPTLNPYYKDPICLTKAIGSTVWDTDGKEYLDLIGGIVTISVGHNHPRIVKKTREMLDNNAPQHTSFLYFTGHMEKLAMKLAEVSPKGLTKSYFTNSGSEANEMAVLSARVSTNEQMVVSLKHGYHGGTNVTMSLCGHGTWKFRGQPQTAVVYAAEPYCYRCPFGATRGKCNFECAQDIKNVIETTTHGKIAAFIAEPIQGVGGFIDPPVEYFKRAHDIVKSFGGKYISDEVQTGSGRLGKHYFAIEEAGIIPDIITTAKGFGNGAPIGAVIAKSEVADALAGKLHFNTFGGDPYQAMQAAETIDIIRDENLIENAALMGKYLNEGFLALQNEFPLIGDVRGRGLCVGLELVKDRKTKVHAKEEMLKLMEATKNNGLLIGKGGLSGNIVRIAPPMNITRSECDSILAKMRKSLSEVK
jgi:4-aminobutyrate aminotransferase-like enzyme